MEASQASCGQWATRLGDSYSAQLTWPLTHAMRADRVPAVALEIPARKFVWRRLILRISDTFPSISATALFLSNRAVKPRGFSPEDRRRVPCLGLGRGGNA